MVENIFRVSSIADTAFFDVAVSLVNIMDVVVLLQCIRECIRFITYITYKGICISQCWCISPVHQRLFLHEMDKIFIDGEICINKYKMDLPFLLFIQYIILRMKKMPQVLDNLTLTSFCSFNFYNSPFVLCVPGPSVCHDHILTSAPLGLLHILLNFFFFKSTLDEHRQHFSSFYLQVISSRKLQITLLLCQISLLYV